MEFHYGGQAVIEGVMMRGPTARAVAVRLASGKVHVEVTPARSWLTLKPWYGWPIIRGLVTLAETLTAGIDALLVSANLSEDPEEHLTRRETVLAVGLALLLSVGLFIILPTVLVSFLRGLIAHRFWLNLTEGVVRVSILTLYLVAISRLPEVQRLLAYHGAEHQAIHAYENQKSLEPEVVRDFSLKHPRCGTSFLLVVMLVSVILFSFFGWPGIWQRIVLRLVLLPVVAGVSYELIRWAGRSRSPLVQAISWPGLMLQRYTTRTPDDSQIEVAAAALQAVLADKKVVQSV